MPDDGHPAGRPETAGAGRATRRARRVWIVNHYAGAPDQPTGTRHYALARAVVREGASATIFAAGFSHGIGTGVDRAGRRLARTTRFGGVTFVWLWTFPYFGNTWRRMVNMASFAVILVVAQATRRRPDVIMGSTVHPFAALAAWFVARLRGARFFFEVRDLWPQTLVDLGAMRPSSPLARILWAIESFLVRRAEVVITVLPGMVDYLHGRGLPAGHVVYLPNGVDLVDEAAGNDGRLPAPDPAADRLIADAAARRSAGTLILGYLGAHGRVNRLDVVLEAFALARDRSAMPMALYLVGDGPEKTGLIELAGRLGLTDAVVFADPVAKLRVPDLLATVDVGVVHTTTTPVYRYGVSFNKLFDYMAARIPIAFATSTAYDPIEASGGGLTVRPDDPEALAEAFVRLAELSPEERRAMGEAGRRFLEREHDLARIGRRFAELAGVVDAGPADRSYTRDAPSGARPAPARARSRRSG